MYNFSSLLTMVLLCSLVSACGGGSGSAGAISAPATPSTPSTPTAPTPAPDLSPLEKLQQDSTYIAYVSENTHAWDRYKVIVENVQYYYNELPVGININKEWFASVSVPNSALTFNSVDYVADYPMSHGVGYGDQLQLANGNTLVFYTNWAAGVPDFGNAVSIEYNGTDIVEINAQRISGATRSHVLKNANGTATVLLPGVDEGKESRGDSDSYVYNFETKEWQGIGIVTGAHGSTVFDFENDGDQDVIAQNWSTNFDSRPIIFKNLGNGQFEAVEIPTTFDVPAAMSLTAFYEDENTLGLVITDTYGISLKYDIPGERNVIAYYDSSLNELYAKNVVELPLPYFEREVYKNNTDIVFSGTESWDGTVGLSHDVQTLVADLDYDGDSDIIISSLVWSDNRPLGVVQLLINENGTYVDRTDDRLFNFVTAGGSYHQIELIDVNGDNYVDILLSDHGNGFNNYAVDGQDFTDIGQRTKVLVNDGTGHFLTVLHSQLSPSRTTSDIPAIDKNNKLFFTNIETTYLYSGDEEATIHQTKMKYAMSTGPFGLDPANYGVPGFNEFFYLLNNPGVIESIVSGQYASGLEHYLAEGEALGLSINATDL